MDWAIVLQSTYHGSATVSPADWVVNEITPIGSRCGPLAAAIRLLERKLVAVDKLVSGIFPLEEWEQAFKKQNSLKIFFKIS